MATWYVNSAATGTGAGTSWVNACTTLAAAITLSAAGDDFDVLSTHSESTGAALTLTFKGTVTSPNRVFSSDNTNSPAQGSDLVAGATIAVAGNFNLNIRGFVYIWGVMFNCAVGATTAGSFQLASTAAAHQLIFDNCTLNQKSTDTLAAMFIGAGSAAQKIDIQFLNSTISMSGAQSIQCSVVDLLFKNCIIGGTSVPTQLVSSTGSSDGSLIIFDGTDLSALGSGKTLVSGSLAGPTVVQIRNCKLGSSVTVAGTPSGPGGLLLDLINSDSAATGYRQERYRYQGTLTTSTTVYNNASDGVTPISWQVVTTANAKRQSPFECFEIVQWAAAGTYAASLVQITSATAALTNADVWVEAEYLGNGSFPISSLASSAPANLLTAGSALAAGTWATGGLGHNYQLALPSFTTALAGYIRFTVKIAKASLTVNIDPAVTVA